MPGAAEVGTGIRTYTVPDPFDLHATAGPVAWSPGRWPDVDWIDNSLIWVGREGERVVHRSVRQTAPASVTIVGNATGIVSTVPGSNRFFGTEMAMPVFADPVLRKLQAAFPGLYPHSQVRCSLASSTASWVGASGGSRSNGSAPGQCSLQRRN